MEWVLKYFVCEVLVIINSILEECVWLLPVVQPWVSQCSPSASQAHAHLRLSDSTHCHRCASPWNADAWPRASQGPPPSLSTPLLCFHPMYSFSLMLKQDQFSSNINNIPQVLVPFQATISFLLFFTLNFLEDLSMITVFVPMDSPIYCLWLFVHTTAYVGICVKEHVCAYVHTQSYTYTFLKMPITSSGLIHNSQIAGFKDKWHYKLSWKAMLILLTWKLSSKTTDLQVVANSKILFLNIYLASWVKESNRFIMLY